MSRIEISPSPGTPLWPAGHRLAFYEAVAAMLHQKCGRTVFK